MKNKWRYLISRSRHLERRKSKKKTKRVPTKQNKTKQFLFLFLRNYCLIGLPRVIGSFRRASRAQRIYAIICQSSRRLWSLSRGFDSRLFSRGRNRRGETPRYLFIFTSFCISPLAFFFLFFLYFSNVFTFLKCMNSFSFFFPVSLLSS